MNTNTRISLVIPVYNEVERIHECLEAVFRQQRAFYEVIVVDNNSTDGTAAIAASFPGVRLVRESRQGVVYARDRGFNEARGDIIARIDADTLIPDDWTRQLVAIFANTAIDAVTGSVHYRDIAMQKTVSRIDLFWRRRMAALLGRDVALQGANMALRRTAWRVVCQEICHERGQHEDFDLAIHLTRRGHVVVFKEQLRAGVCYRQAQYNALSFSHYAAISPQTYLRHGVSKGCYMYVVVAFVVVLYPVISLLSKGYDAQLGRFTLVKLFSPGGKARVNPATYID